VKAKKQSQSNKLKTRIETKEQKIRKG